jgi:hypothetical protein
MRYIIIFISLLACVFAQVPPTNVLGSQSPRVLPDHRIEFTLKAPTPKASRSPVATASAIVHST